jgi:hypothetical protein
MLKLEAYGLSEKEKKIVKKLFRKHKDLYSILYKSLENRRKHIKIGNNYSGQEKSGRVSSKNISLYVY